MSAFTISSLGAGGRRLWPGLLVAALGLLAACTSTGKHVSGFDQLDLAPGDTGNCTSSPCRVFLQIPAGTGSYEVTANEVKVGVFPGGRNANLGSYWQSQAIEIKGMDVPKAYAYIPVQR